MDGLTYFLGGILAAIGIAIYCSCGCCQSSTKASSKNHPKGLLESILTSGDGSKKRSKHTTSLLGLGTISASRKRRKKRGHSKSKKGSKSGSKKHRSRTSKTGSSKKRHRSRSGSKSSKSSKSSKHSKSSKSKSRKSKETVTSG